MTTPQFFCFRRLELNEEIMPTEEQIEEVAAMMFAAALAFTNTIGRKGWAWEACDEQAKNYWRNVAKLSWNVFHRPGGKSSLP